MRVLVVTESFLPSVNGVTGSVLRVLEHLHRQDHTALVVAPEGGPEEHEGTQVVRVPSVSLPGVSALPVGLPTRRLQEVTARFRPDVVHLASPFVLGAGGWRRRAGSACPRSRCTRPTWRGSSGPTARG